VSDQQVLDLVRDLRQVAADFGYPQSADDRNRIDFDRAAAEVLHRRMKLNTVEAANNEVWNFLALVAAPDLVRWRWLESDNAERWISSDRTRHMFARLWWQALTFAEVAPDGNVDFTLLRSLNERDLNALTERRSIGGVPRLARALARMVLTDGERDTGASVLLRQMGPFLRRRIVFIDFASLTDDQIDDQLRAIRAAMPRGTRRETPSPSTESDDPSGQGQHPVDLSILRGSSTRRFDPASQVTSSSTVEFKRDARSAFANGRPTVVDVCSGAGGLILGLESAGFNPLLLLDNRSIACETLRTNRPRWNVQQLDLLEFAPGEHPQLRGVDLLSAGLPRVQASATINRSRGSDLELELLKSTIDLFGTLQPQAFLLDNLPGLATQDQYAPIRDYVATRLSELGYDHQWLVVNAAEYGVPQNRPHGILVALKAGVMRAFRRPEALSQPLHTVGQTLRDSMTTGGWSQADQWAALANRPAPTIVGGSWDRGGADLGPTGSKRAWAQLGVDGATVADDPPGPDFVFAPELGREGLVQLTVEQVARLQGFPPDWVIAGRKTARYRQVGEAMPPPLAEALGRAIAAVLTPA